AAGAARAGMTGLRSDAATERWLRCASTRANHRVLPLRCGQQLASTPCRTRNTGFTVAKTSEGSILPRKVSESGECRLNQADLREANLQEANLYEANLKGATLFKTNL